MIRRKKRRNHCGLLNLVLETNEKSVLLTRIGETLASRMEWNCEAEGRGRAGRRMGMR